MCVLFLDSIMGRGDDLTTLFTTFALKFNAFYCVSYFNSRLTQRFILSIAVLCGYMLYY